jgi:ADP-ribosylglycohydrolase
MEDKAKAAVLGAFVADALSLGPHWVYNTNVIDKKFGVVDRFLDPLTSHHKGKHAGDLTHYGDQMMVLLASTAARAGRFDRGQFTADWREFMASYDGYFDQATKTTLQNLADGKTFPDCGSASDELGGAARIAPLVACYPSDLTSLIQAARAQTALTHNNRTVIASAEFFGRVVFAVLQGQKPAEAIPAAMTAGDSDETLQESLAVALDSGSGDSRQTIADFGQMCAIEAALPATLHLILKYEGNFKQALIANVMAGGDSAGRGMLTGMVLGAYHGMAAIPGEWLTSLKSRGRIEELLAAFKP